MTIVIAFLIYDHTNSPGGQWMINSDMFSDGYFNLALFGTTVSHEQYVLWYQWPL